MSAKTIFSTALVWTLLGFGAVRGQTPGAMNPPDSLPPPRPYGGAAETAPQPPLVSQRFQLSSWIRGEKYQCCDSVGASGPIESELFFRLGPSLVAGNGTVADVLQTGLYLGGGGRVLFFNPAQNDAWTVELGVANISNHAHAPTSVFPLHIFVPSTAGTPTAVVTGATLHDLERTFFNMGLGNEWYLRGSAASQGPMWRVGFDGGGRWGSASASFSEIPHRNDTIGGLWAAFHTDVDIPCGCCLFTAGFRVEYGYTWSDILQIQNKSDTQDVNILFNFGIRF
jgi:hypothetical protein